MYHHWGSTSVYRPLSYLFIYLNHTKTQPQKLSCQMTDITVIYRMLCMIFPYGSVPVLIQRILISFEAILEIDLLPTIALIELSCPVKSSLTSLSR